MNNEHRTGELNIEWAYCIVDEFIQNGVELFCISPGSRSTPLTIAVSKHPKAKIKVILDERSAAFFALGYAKATGKAAVLICTSGSAVANYLPAVIDAHYDQLPLVVITADRPPELRNIGANQTIDQVKIFSEYVRYTMDVPCPTEKIPITTLISIVDQCVNYSKYPISGPVHLNCMYRKPLACNLEKISDIIGSFLDDNKDNNVQTMYDYCGYSIKDSIINKIIDKINSSSNCLIIVGELKYICNISAVEQLLITLNFPVITDILSGLRMSSELLNCYDHYDLMLDDKTINNLDDTDLVIHIGGRIVSDKLLHLLSSIKSLEYIQISKKQICIDPERIVSWKLNCDIPIFCEKLLSKCSGSRIRKATPFTKNSKQLELNKIIDLHIYNNNKISEISIHRIVSQMINRDNCMFIGNSMPIRDMNNFAVRIHKSIINIAGKRGTSGIDGIISTAIGYANGLNKNLTLIIGDLSFLHDMNSLMLIRNSNVKVIIIVINNDGGGIFSFLPIADNKELLDNYFAVSHGYSFEQVAKMFDLNYYNPILNSEFIEIYQKCLTADVNSLIEVSTNREMNILTHKKLSSLMKDYLNE